MANQPFSRRGYCKFEVWKLSIAEMAKDCRADTKTKDKAPCNLQGGHIDDKSKHQDIFRRKTNSVDTNDAIA